MSKITSPFPNPDLQRLLVANRPPKAAQSKAVNAVKAVAPASQTPATTAPKVQPMHAQNAHGDVFIKSAANKAATSPQMAPATPGPSKPQSLATVMQSFFQSLDKTNKKPDPQQPNPSGINSKLFALGALAALAGNVLAPASLVAQPNIINQLIDALPK